MGVLAAAALGVVGGFGLWLGLTAARGIRVLPAATRLVPKSVPVERAATWLAGSLLIGLIVGLVTGWPVAGLGTALGVLVGPAALGGTAQRAQETATADAIATWADMIRDTMAGASGLEESLIQTAAVAPAAIRPELEVFAHRLRHQPLEAALDGLAADLDHSSADLIVASLAAAARLEARDLGSLLARLAEAIRGDVRMRTRVEIGRSRIRTSGRIAVATTAATVVFLYLFARHLLEPYDTAAGQAWLLVVMAVFFGAGVLLHRYSRLETPERFTLRHIRRVGAGPMTVFGVTLAGAAIGLGLFLAIRAVFPRPVPLAVALADLTRQQPSRSETPDTSRLRGRFGQTALRIIEASGLVDTESLRLRLRTLGKPIEEHAYDKIVGGIGGFAIPIAFGLTLTAGGVPISPGAMAVGAGVMATAGFVFPDFGLSDRIERRRRDFRHSLSAYLDLVTIILAGGGGLETALQTSADLGDGWAFAEIRNTLRRARLTNRTPWEAFDQLGTELGVDELRELAAAAHLAGDQGARIRASLAAKADSMRAAQTAAIETQAEAATEKMLLPVVGLVVGMILFIGFGVVQAISTPGTVP